MFTNVPLNLTAAGVLDDFLDGAYDNASFIDTIKLPEEDGKGAVAGFPASRVHIPYALVGTFALLNASFMIISYFMDPKDVKPEKPAEAEENVGTSTSPAYQWTLVTLTGFYTLVSVTLEVAVGKFLPAYAVHHYGLSRSSGAYIVSLFYVGFTLGRVVAVPMSVKLSPMQMMNAAQAGLFGSAALLAFIDYEERVLWTCSFTLGACLSPLFGSATVWLSKQVALSHDFMSIIMTMVTFGTLTPPLFVGSYIESHPHVLTWAVLAAACTMLAVCWAMHATASVHRRVYRRCPIQESLPFEQDELMEKLHRRELDQGEQPRVK
ncbi:sodium-dependent glucose transporter 1A-like [Tropilaelaps mercedesae]|uniref:Major facilitator superfamily domain-containing protein 4A n=1 Tax=Tropilaelaps mercedesae TaxID=418985 RepID=A0A1V9XPV8_9ACAR|nr:sodium-dependent glucose transporter 1A-like [Tropilaelaps mercedesae]